MRGAPKRDALLEGMIDAAVMGDPTSPWDIDPKHPVIGTLQDRFNAGDKQILLWTLKFSARERKPAPEWATEALADVLYEAATGKFESWDEGFGRIFARKKRTTMYKKKREMLAAYNRVIELSKDNSIGYILFARIGEELAIGKNRVAEYYGRVKKYLEKKDKIGTGI
jgi:hypothetical protein